MKKLNVILTLALFIVTGLLIGVVMNRPAEAKKKTSAYQTKCERLEDRLGMPVLFRCENKEAICYESGNGVSCFKK